MTRRERLEARLQKRQEWADKRAAKSEQAFQSAHNATAGIPFGQPILVGHHSEKRHRRTLERADNAMRRGLEHDQMAKHHEQAAAGLERALDTSIYSDDPDAIEALEAKAARLEAERDAMKECNARYRKGGLAALTDAERAAFLRLVSFAPYHKTPHPSYELTNIGGNIRRCRERIEHIKRRAVELEQDTPRWIWAKWAGTDRDGRPVKKGDGCLYFPKSKELLTGEGATAYLEAQRKPANEQAAAPADDICPDGPTCPDPECIAARAELEEPASSSGFRFGGFINNPDNPEG